MTALHWTGVVIAVIAFLLIGVFHPIVIKAEYYFGKRVWPVFLLAGLIFLAASLWVAHPVGSSALGVLGCSCLWSIGELFEQEQRVARGWYPRRPGRK